MTSVTDGTVRLPGRVALEAGRWLTRLVINGRSVLLRDLPVLMVAAGGAVLAGHVMPEAASWALAVAAAGMLRAWLRRDADPLPQPTSATAPVAVVDDLAAEISRLMRVRVTDELPRGTLTRMVQTALDRVVASGALRVGGTPAAHARRHVCAACGGRSATGDPEAHVVTVRVEANAATGTARPATKDDAVDVRAARPATTDDAVNVLVTKPLSAPATAAASPAAPATTVAVAADPKIAALRNALLGGEIDVHYQLVFDRHRQPAEVEALVRWHHPESGTLLPGEFLPMARDAGLLSAMTAHVTRRALRDWDALRRDMGVQLSLNGDLELGGEADGLPMLDALLRSRDIDPAMLCWEYPAAQAQRFSDRLREVAGILRSHGLRTAVDGWPIDLDPRLAADWGVGSIKVDGRDGAAQGLTETFVQSAHAAGLLVGVSGLETEAEVELCRALGVDRFQGYQLARPQPARALVAEPGGSGAGDDS